MMHDTDPMCQCNSCSHATLNAVLDELIPTSNDNVIPGLLDLNASQELLTSPNSKMILEELLVLNQMSNDEYQVSFGELTKDVRQEFVRKNSGQWRRITDNIGPVALAFYFENSKVLVSLGEDFRPHFPRGHDVHQGSWELLEPVYLRGQIFKEVK